MLLQNKRRFKKTFFSIVLLFFTVGLGKSVAQSTVGTDFWVSFLPAYIEKPHTLSLIITGPRTCHGTITNPHTHWSTTFNVLTGTSTSVTIPKEQAYDDNSDCVSDIGLHVVSTDSISLYASNFQSSIFDVTNVLPTTSLDCDYVIQTYPETSSRSSEFNIIATENNTTVDINLSCNSLQGHEANQPFSVTLNAGQCYQIQSAAASDLSGSVVHAHGSKRIAVFSGNTCTNVPSNNYCCCDHVVEQMMPTACWGNRFVVTGSCKRDNDIIRITALNDNCQIVRDSTVIATINAKQSYQFVLTSDKPSTYIETSEPAMVYLYYTSSQYGGLNGDPSMVIINPIEQKMNEVTFSTFNSGTSEYHYVNIVTDSDKVSAMRLDGSNIASSFQPVTGNPDYSFARVSVSDGAHTLTNLTGGFVAHVYGLGFCESYAYSVGSMMRNLASTLMVDGHFISDLPDGFDLCVNKSAVFELNLDFEFSQVDWTWGDGETGSGSPVSHHYENPGDYTVTCKVYKEENGQPVLALSLTTEMHIHKYNNEEFEVSSCDSYTWMGQTYDTTGYYEWTDQTPGGCESIAHLNLTIYRSPQLEIHGLTEVAASSDLWPGIYNYCLADSLELENCTIEWTCDNPEWAVLPHEQRYWCKLVTTSPGTSTLTATAHCDSGCDGHFVMAITATAYGVDEHVGDNVSLYPNPAKSQVTVQAPQLTSLRMLDCFGQTVKEISCEKADTVTLDLSGMAKGIYLMEITTTAGKTIKRLIIQ